MVHGGRPAHVCVRRSIHNCVWSSPPWLQAVCTYVSWQSPRGTWVRRVRVCVWQCVCTPHSLSCLGTYPSPGYWRPRQESPLWSAGRRCPWCWRLWRPAPTQHLPATFKAHEPRRSQDNKASILPLGTPGFLWLSSHLGAHTMVVDSSSVSEPGSDRAKLWSSPPYSADLLPENIK